MRAVNLLPKEVPVKSFEAKRGLVFGAAGGFALVTVAMVALMFSAGGSIGEQQTELDTLNAELAALPRPEPDGGEAGIDAALAAQKAERITALSGALASRVAWDRVLRQISQVLPEDVWLTGLTSQGAETPDPGTTAAPGASIILTGATYSHSGVARLLSRLGVVPALGSVQLQSSTTMKLEPRSIVQFSIHATVKPPGSAQ
jgi:Tfp pilus assembly protein PilN